tara:strand:+ start:24636 stop:25169 length:534 start_codon:yes stop_codon:yes gene_type:complete
MCKNKFKSFNRELLSLIKKHNLKIILFAILILLILFLKNFLIIISLTALGALSLLHQRWTGDYLGFELCTLATVLCGMLYGAKAGILVGVFSVSLGMIIAGNIHPSMLLSIICFGFIGLVASFFTIESIFWVGLGLTVLYDAVMVPVYLLMGSNHAATFSFTLTHILFNAVIFSLLA